MPISNEEENVDGALGSKTHTGQRGADILKMLAWHKTAVLCDL